MVAEVLSRPGLFRVVFSGLSADDPLIRMRAADAVEKITARRPDLLRAYKDKLIRDVAATDQKEVRRHVAELTITGTAAMRARGRRLLGEIDAPATRSAAKRRERRAR